MANIERTQSPEIDLDVLAVRALATMPAESRRNLEWVGCDDPVEVAADLARIQRGERDALLADCLDGAEDEATTAAWHEYVDHVEAMLRSAGWEPRA